MKVLGKGFGTANDRQRLNGERERFENPPEPSPQGTATRGTELLRCTCLVQEAVVLLRCRTGLPKRVPREC
jgi:hypothetical protein